jgi:hypothetical protein
MPEPFVFEPYMTIDTDNAPQGLIDCANSDNFEQDVEDWIKANKPTCSDYEYLREFLKDLGAFEEIDTDTNETNLERLVWIASCDLKGYGEFFFVR